MRIIWYDCGRCGLPKSFEVEDDAKLKKTIKCVYCDSGRMRLRGLPPATGWRTKSRRNG